MAIKIDIPDLGTVTVDGMAEENTLQDILKHLKIAAKIKALETKQANGQIKKFGNTAKKAGAEHTKAITALEDEINSHTSNTAAVKKNTKAAKILNSELLNTGKSAAVASLSFIKNTNTIGENVIDTSKAIMDTVIDVTTSLVSSVATLGSAIPFIGGLSDASAKVVGAFGEVAKFGNDFMANQLKLQLTSYRTFTETGASFAGGMNEMTQHALASNLSLAGFTKVVKDSRKNIFGMGISASTASSLLADKMALLGKGSDSTRTRLFKLGYSFEEQGDIMTEFLSRERISRNLNNISNEEVRTGTIEYAKNLKVLSDLTGKDGKALMAKARDESRRAALVNSLDSDQRKAFTQTYAALAKFGPEVQAALVQQVSGIGIINPAVAASGDLSEMIKTLSASVRAGQKDMVTVTTTAMAETAKQIRESGNNLASSVDIATIAGVRGIATDISKVMNAVVGYFMTPEEAQKSRSAVDLQFETADTSAKKMADITDSMVTSANVFQKLANDNMAAYASLLDTTVTATTKSMQVFAKSINYIVHHDFAGLEKYIGSLTNSKGHKKEEKNRQEWMYRMKSANHSKHGSAADLAEYGSRPEPTLTASNAQKQLTPNNKDRDIATTTTNTNSPDVATTASKSESAIPSHHYSPEETNALLRAHLKIAEKTSKNLSKLVDLSQ